MDDILVKGLKLNSDVLLYPIEDADRQIVRKYFHSVGKNFTEKYLGFIFHDPKNHISTECRAEMCSQIYNSFGMSTLEVKEGRERRIEPRFLVLGYSRLDFEVAGCSYGDVLWVYFFSTDVSLPTGILRGMVNNMDLNDVIEGILDKSLF